MRRYQTGGGPPWEGVGTTEGAASPSRLSVGSHACGGRQSGVTSCLGDRSRETGYGYSVDDGEGPLVWA